MTQDNEEPSAASAGSAVTERKTHADSLQNTLSSRFDAAPYGVYRWARGLAPRRNAARQRRGDDGTGAVAYSRTSVSADPHITLVAAHHPADSRRAAVRGQA